MNLNCSAIGLSVPPTFLNRAVLRATRNRSLNRVLGLASSSSGNFALYEWRIVRLKSTPAALIGYVNDSDHGPQHEERDEQADAAIGDPCSGCAQNVLRRVGNAPHR